MGQLKLGSLEIGEQLFRALPALGEDGSHS